jgi:hypothetical protein
MNWAARKRGEREMNGGPRTRKEWGIERASEAGLYPRGFGWPGRTRPPENTAHLVNRIVSKSNNSWSVNSSLANLMLLARRNPTVQVYLEVMSRYNL